MPCPAPSSFHHVYEEKRVPALRNAHKARWEGREAAHQKIKLRKEERENAAAVLVVQSCDQLKVTFVSIIVCCKY